MSQLIIQVSRIEKVRPHPQADRLEIGEIRGWQVVVPKDRYQAGQLVTYIPPDSVMPAPLSDRLGITKYLSNGRVRCAKLRGEPSFGVVMELENPEWEEGQDVSEHYGITKWIPPLIARSGDAVPDYASFFRYTEIENMRNFPAAFEAGEEVVGTEKIHGTNCRIGIVRSDDDRNLRVAGSRKLRRGYPSHGGMATNLYWHPWSIASVEAMMMAVAGVRRASEIDHQVILFGEVYGKVQSLRYGLPNGLGFRAFDLMVDGKYLDYDDFARICREHGVETVPLVYRGPFSLDAIRTASDGPSLVPGADHYREGVVVKPARERRHPAIGRVILKYVSDTYLLGDQSDAEEV